MTPSQLRHVWRANPFRPFTIHLAGGNKVEVPHQDFMALSPTGRFAFVYGPHGEHFHIDVMLVTALEERSDESKGSRKSGRSKK